MFESNLMLELGWDVYSAREIAQMSAQDIPPGDYRLVKIRISDTDMELVKPVVSTAPSTPPPPVIAVHEGGRYRVVDGHYRLAIAKGNGQQIVQAYVRI